MTAAEIRERKYSRDYPLFQCEMLREIAAQLAELNEAIAGKWRISTEGE